MRKAPRRSRRAAAGAALASARGSVGKVFRPLESTFARVLAILGAILVGSYSLIKGALGFILPPLRKAGRRVAAALHAVSKLVTPARGLLVAAIGCAILLALSQFADYRGISIGGTDYAPSIASVAPAPEVGRAALGSAHSYAMIPVAIVAIVLLVIAAWTKRWQLCRLVFLLGLGVIAVAILIDRPAGLDVGNLRLDYNGVEASLLGGFWMEIFAGAGLALTSLLLGSELRRERHGADADRSKRPLRLRMPGRGFTDTKKAADRKPRRARRGSGAEGASA